MASTANKPTFTPSVQASGNPPGEIRQTNDKATAAQCPREIKLERFAPIAVFAYKRPDHLGKALESLAACPEWDVSLLYIFCDGPRNISDAASVAEVQRVANAISHPRKQVVVQTANLGLARSVISGVSSLCDLHGRVVVVEDDLIVTRDFLQFMNSALDAYSDREDVLQVSGHMFDVPEFNGCNTALLLPITTTWGWATWRRAWVKLQPRPLGWERLQQDPQARARFNLAGSYDYLSMLKRQIAGRSDSWGIRWYWSVFACNGLTCFPPRSLVRNIGMDGSGTHGRGPLRRFNRSRPPALLGAIWVNSDARICTADEYHALCRAIWRQNGGWRGRTLDWIKRFALWVRHPR